MLDISHLLSAFELGKWVLQNRAKLFMEEANKFQTVIFLLG